MQGEPMYTWRVVVAWPDWKSASMVVGANTETTACEKVSRFYRRYHGRAVSIYDVYRVPCCLRAEAEALVAATSSVPMTLSQALEATLSGLHSLNRIEDMYRRALRKETAYTTSGKE
jgi:hypothetical protein